MHPLEQAMKKHAITVTSVFVPWSKSRNKTDDHKSLNWNVRVLKSSRTIIITDYSAGIAHCPSYKPGPMSLWHAEAIEFEVEQGRQARERPTPSWGSLILPNPVDVIHSLITDAEVLNYSSFEDWASDFGYDPDSRKAEAIYTRECLATALKLRNGLGEAVLAELTESARDY